MIIVSMCTYNYFRWIYPFIISVQRHNPGVNIEMYLINFPEEKIKKCRETFPGVNFNSYNGDFLKNKERYNVTYLKPQFLGNHINEDNLLWIDVTALIRTDLSHIGELLNNHESVLVTRPNSTRDKTNFCAEIIGLSKDSNQFELYNNEVNKHAPDWFSDQISLNIINKPYLLEQGEYCNFEYNAESKTWSDRGRKPSGKSNFGDVIYIFEQYMKDLNCKDDFLKWIDEIEPRPRVVAFTDEDKWCFFSSASKITSLLSYWYNFLLIHDAKSQQDLVRKFGPQFVWSRCSAFRTKKLLLIFPKLRDKTICSFTTGGHMMPLKIMQHMDNSHGFLGVITQNEDVKNSLQKQKLDQEVFMIGNGVDTEMFKPIKRNPQKRFVAGFAARNDGSVDKAKGYTEFFVNPCDKLGIERIEGNFKEKFIPHTEMPQFYDSMDVLIQVSTHEGCSNTVQEAMAAGIPCIVSKVGYHGIVCEHKKNIYFVERNEQQVINALKELKTNPQLYKTISDGARQFAMKHCIYDKVTEYKDIFDKLYKGL